MTLDDILQPFHTRDGWLIAGANLLPLLGVFLANWDASTLVALYWLETAIIGLWLVLQISVSSPDQTRGSMLSDERNPMSGIGLGLFVLAHAGIFMAVHFFFLTALLPGEWLRHLSPPLALLTGFIIPSGLWIPLLGLFVVRGVITVTDIRARAPLKHVILAFYLRIVLMQGTILAGGMVSLLLGSPAVLLVILIGLKVALDLYMGRVVDYVNDSIDRARQTGSGT